MGFTEMKLLHQMLITGGVTGAVVSGLVFGGIGAIHYFKDDEFYILKPSSSASVKEPVPDWANYQFDDQILQSVLNNKQVVAKINAKVNAAVSESAKKNGVDFNNLTPGQLSVLKNNAQVAALLNEDLKFAQLPQNEQGKYVQKSEYDKREALFEKAIKHAADKWRITRCYGEGQEATQGNPDHSSRSVLELLEAKRNKVAKFGQSATNGMKNFAKYFGFVDAQGEGDIDKLVEFYVVNKLDKVQI